MNNPLRSNPLIEQMLRARSWPPPLLALALLIALVVGGFALRGAPIGLDPGNLLLTLWVLPLAVLGISAVFTARRLRDESFQLVRGSTLTDAQVTFGLGLSQFYALRLVLAVAFGLLAALIDDTLAGGLASALCLAGLYFLASMLGAALMLRWGHRQLGVVLGAAGCILLLILAQVIHTFYPGIGMPGGPSPAHLRLSVILLRLGLPGQGPALMWAAAVLPALIGWAAGWIPWRAQRKERRLRLEMAGCLLAAAMAVGALSVVAGTSQRRALAAVYRAMGGDGWKDHTGWLTDQPVCVWYGVSCSGDRVDGLYLQDNNLRGDLPPEIGLLVSLRDLDLSYNNEVSSLPPEIDQLTSLVWLDLSFNRVSRLPPEIGALGHLYKLDLTSNQLTALPPEIGRLSGLVELNLGGMMDAESSNYLTALPPEIGGLASLKKLNLNANRLASLPPEMAQLTSLEELSLWNNGLTEVPPIVFRITSLRTLALGGNHLAHLPPDIAKLSRLENLALSFNQLEDLPPEIGRLKNLDNLALAFNNLTALPPEAGQLTNLKWLDVNANPIKRLPRGLCRLPGTNFAVADVCAPGGADPGPSASTIANAYHDVSPLPETSPEMTVALTDGALPCGAGRVGWGLWDFRWDDFPGCGAAFPDVRLYCLNDQGQWADPKMSIFDWPIHGPGTISVQSEQDGVCGIFPKK